MQRENQKSGNIPCRLLFSRSILIRRICSMIAFRHKALSSLADLLRPTIWAQDALWGITPNSGSVSKKNKTYHKHDKINITNSCFGIFFQWYTVCRLRYLTDILKTNLTKFAVIWVKRCQKARLSSPRSSKITVTKGKERSKRKSEEKERRRREKSNGCTLSFYNSYFGDSFWLKKNCWTQKGPFGDNVVKNPARYRNFHKKVIFQSVTQADQEKQIRALPSGVKPMTLWSPVQIWPCINQAQNSLSHLYQKLLM